MKKVRIKFIDLDFIRRYGRVEMDVDPSIANTLISNDRAVLVKEKVVTEFKIEKPIINLSTETIPIYKQDENIFPESYMIN